MKTKLLFGAITVLLGVITYLKIQNSYQNSEIKDLEIKVFDMQEIAKTELKKVRDSSLSASIKDAESSQKRFDSILNLPPTIIYKPYVKEIYPYRNLDTALRVHSEHKRDSNR